MAGQRVGEYQKLPHVLGFSPRDAERAIALGGKSIDYCCGLGLVVRSKLGEADTNVRGALGYEKSFVGGVFDFGLGMFLGEGRGLQANT